MKKVFYFLGFMMMAAWVVGFCFRILHLPGAKMLLYIGGTGTAFLFLPVAFLQKLKLGRLTETSEKYQWIIGMISIITFVFSTWLRFVDESNANFLMVLSFVLFGFGFLPYLFLNLYKQSLKEL